MVTPLSFSSTDHAVDRAAVGRVDDGHLVFPADRGAGVNHVLQHVVEVGPLGAGQVRDRPYPRRRTGVWHCRQVLVKTTRPWETFRLPEHGRREPGLVFRDQGRLVLGRADGRCPRPCPASATPRACSMLASWRTVAAERSRFRDRPRADRIEQCRTRMRRGRRGSGSRPASPPGSTAGTASG